MQKSSGATRNPNPETQHRNQNIGVTRSHPRGNPREYARGTESSRGSIHKSLVPGPYTFNPKLWTIDLGTSDSNTNP
jgi:hypothetical protein